MELYVLLSINIIAVFFLKRMCPSKIILFPNKSCFIIRWRDAEGDKVALSSRRTKYKCI